VIRAANHTYGAMVFLKKQKNDQEGKGTIHLATNRFTFEIIPPPTIITHYNVELADDFVCLFCL